MELTVRGKNLEITEALRTYVENTPERYKDILINRLKSMYSLEFQT